MDNSSLNDLVQNFKTTPFLFVGSGLSRRYYNLPDWKTLLLHFINIITDNDPIGWTKYAQMASGKYARIASLVEKDFNTLWFKNKNIRKVSKEQLNYIVKNDCSPFKAEIAAFLLKEASINPIYLDEISLLKKLMIRNISGIITTNYDLFLEKIAPDYNVYVGQEELLFSSIQNIAEIYKIHGSVKKPKSIVITEEDYDYFNEKAAYLSAKLLTIFMENPIIFIGYSLNDINIRNILQSIAKCCSSASLIKLAEKFILVEHNKNDEPAEIISNQISIGDEVIPMTGIKLHNYIELYDALKNRKSTLPVKVLRMFRNEFYQYSLTNTPSKKIYVAGIDDPRVRDEDLVLAIATPGEIGLKGLRGLQAKELYHDALFNDLHVTPDNILMYAYPGLRASNNKLPIFKYLTSATQEYPDIIKKNGVSKFDDLLNATIKKGRERRSLVSHSVSGLYKSYTIDKVENLNRLITDISFLKENEIEVQDLEMLLKDIFHKYPNILDDETPQYIRSEVRRMIRILDWLKYGRKYMQKS